ncbi:hypothetical protein [Trueperella pyogenes]
MLKKLWNKRPVNCSIIVGAVIAFVIVLLLANGTLDSKPIDVSKEFRTRIEEFPGMSIKPQIEAAKYGLGMVCCAFFLILGYVAWRTRKKAIEKNPDEARIWFSIGKQALKLMGAAGAVVIGVSVTVWALVLPNANSAGLAELDMRLSMTGKLTQDEFDSFTSSLMITVSHQVTELNRLAGGIFSFGLIMLLGIPLSLFAAATFQRKYGSDKELAA